MKPPGMPPYPTMRRIISDLSRRKDGLLTEMMFIENAMLNNDFRYFKKLVKDRLELRAINESLEDPVAQNYIKSMRK